MDYEKIKVSVITPYYKGLKTIFKTIDSVYNSVNFCGDLDLEYIVIIDSMEDKEEARKKLKEKYKDSIIIIENEKNLGVATSRNKALKKVTSDYTLFLDQDDVIDREYFKSMIVKMKENADLIVCNAYVVNMKNNKKIKMYNKRPNLKFSDFLKGNKILTPGQVLFSKRITKVENLYTGCSKEYRGADDWAAYLNIFTSFENVDVSYVENPVFYYNLHENNYSNNWKELNMSAIKTAEYFLNKVKKEEKIILEKRIKFLYFENKFKDEKYNFKSLDLGNIFKYYTYDLLDYNKVVHFINKKIIGFNK